MNSLEKFLQDNLNQFNKHQDNTTNLLRGFEEEKEISSSPFDVTFIIDMKGTEIPQYLFDSICLIKEHLLPELDVLNIKVVPNSLQENLISMALKSVLKGVLSKPF